MKKSIALACAAMTLAACSRGHDQQAEQRHEQASERPSEAESEAYMRQAEADWANLAVRKNPQLIERIIADDYVGVSSNNAVRDKKQYLQDAAKDVDGKFVSSKLDYVNYRHFGDTVLAQGAESVKRADGSPDLRLIWTDVWMWRGGKWQVVASQDNVVPPPKK